MWEHGKGIWRFFQTASGYGGNLEYVDNRADDIYIYCSCENTYFFNVFYKVNGRIVHKHQPNEAQPGGNYDVSRERQRSMLCIGIDILENINKNLKNLTELCLRK